MISLHAFQLAVKIIFSVAQNFISGLALLVAYTTKIMAQNFSFPTDSLIFLTNRVGRLLANRVRQCSGMEAWGLQHAHMGIMVDLWEQEGVRQQDLAVSNIKDKATIARALDSMEKANLVVRVPDATDKRTKLIYLTHRGREMREKLRPYAYQAMDEATEGLDEESLKTCRKVLQHILGNFNKQRNSSCNSND